MIKAILTLREKDKWGQGHFGARRGKRPDGSTRTHNGIDLVCSVGNQVCSICKGRVTKLGWPYRASEKSHFRYVEITDVDELKHRYFYVSPAVLIGDIVEEGEPIGIAQDLTKTYHGIINHIHYEIKKDGKYIDPTPFAIGGSL